MINKDIATMEKLIIGAIVASWIIGIIVIITTKQIQKLEIFYKE